MVRNYIKKKKPPDWTANDVELALEDIASKKFTLREAPKPLEIPTYYLSIGIDESTENPILTAQK